MSHLRMALRMHIAAFTSTHAPFPSLLHPSFPLLLYTSVPAAQCLPGLGCRGACLTFLDHTRKQHTSCVEVSFLASLLAFLTHHPLLGSFPTLPC